MQHLDEGTIHAWLDGALEADQAREIEAHVATCQTCSANVAEARGLIAASSRILTALDDVPADVTPKRTPAPAKRIRRQWRAAPWVTGIAAALMLAIGLTRMNRQESASFRADTDMRGRLAAAADTAAGPPAAAPQPLEPAALSASSQRAPTAPTGLAGPRTARRTDSRDQAANEVTRIAPAAGIGAATVAVGSARAESRLTPPVAAAPAPPAVVAAADAEAEANQTRASTMKAALADRIAAAKLAPADSTSVAMSEVALGRLAGCYQVNMQVQRNSGFDATTARAVIGRAAGAQREAAAAQQLAPPRLSDIMRLDTVRKPAGFRVLRAPTDSTIGWWFRVGEDTVSVRLLSGLAITVTSKDRVRCPEG